jgi:putative nucleotidyltransferase with HDIG domain
MFAKARSASYGKGVVELDDTGTVSTQELVAKLEATFRSPDYRPPMIPAVALRLIELTRDPRVSFANVRRVLEEDALLTAAVLRRAQSAFYARGGPVASLEAALTRLGLTKLTELFLFEATQARVFRAPGYDEPMAQLRHHSTAVAFLAQEVSRRVGLPDDYAFLCGLLHDAGIATSLLVVAESARGKEAPPFALAIPAVLEVHERACAVLSTAWQLPPDVALVISHHHHPTLEGRVHPFAAAVCVADWLAGQLGFGFASESNQVGALAAAHAIGLSATDAAALRERGEEVLRGLRESGEHPTLVPGPA